MLNRLTYGIGGKSFVFDARSEVIEALESVIFERLALDQAFFLKTTVAGRPLDQSSSIWISRQSHLAFDYELDERSDKYLPGLIDDMNGLIDREGGITLNNDENPMV